VDLFTPGSEQGDLIVAAEMTMLMLQALRPRAIVGVQPRNQVAPRLGNPAVERRDQAEPFLLEDAHAVILAATGLRDRRSGVLRTVFDDDKLEVGKRLASDRCNGVAQPSGTVPHWHENRNLW